jgi:hypothetical protein
MMTFRRNHLHNTTCLHRESGTVPPHFAPAGGNPIGKFPNFPISHSSIFPLSDLQLYRVFYFQHVDFLMKTCPFKELLKPWSHPRVKRDPQRKNLSHFFTISCHFLTFPTIFPLSHEARRELFSQFPKSIKTQNRQVISSRDENFMQHAHLCATFLSHVLEVTPTSWIVSCHFLWTWRRQTAATGTVSPQHTYMIRQWYYTDHTDCEELRVIRPACSNSRGQMQEMLEEVPLSLRAGLRWMAGGPLPSVCRGRGEGISV